MVDFLKEGVDFLAEKAQLLEDKIDDALAHLKDALSDHDAFGKNDKDEPVPYRRYRYNHDTTIAPWPMLETRDAGFPKEQLPSHEWFLKLVKVSLGIAVNRLAWREGGGGSEVRYDKVELDLSGIGLGVVHGSAATVRDDLIEGLARGKLTSEDVKNDQPLKELVQIAMTLLKTGIRDPIDVLATIGQSKENKPAGRPKSIDDYKKLFVTIPLPELSDSHDDDAIFADLRVAGFNPVVIRRVLKLPDNFPVTNAMLAAATGADDTLDKARKEDRLFLADYSALHEAEMGNFPAGPKYVFAPMALFALPPGKGTRRLVSVAIQCGQDPKEFPVYTPTERTLWRRAKAIVQQVDANYHELMSHFAGCHLLMEPFAIATHNELARDDHPIGHLLTPHFEGTLFINDRALFHLFSPAGQVEQILAPTLESCHKIALECLLEENYFNKHMLPTLLKERGVMSEDLYYPYRDDALEIWRAIQDWVQSYVAIFYPDDASVQKDSSLQAWAKQLVAEEGGRVRGFGEMNAKGKLASGQLTTVGYLVEALTMVIFTASAGHASLNFVQQQMTFAPAVPCASYRSMPITEHQASVMPELDQLPPLEMARLQMEFFMLVSGVHHTLLGQYGEEWPQNGSVHSAMVKFQEDLRKVSSIISDRNKSRRPTYTLLQPENIPQSINI